MEAAGDPGMDSLAEAVWQLAYNRK